MQSKTDRKICGTCEFWSGKREPVFDQNGNPKINIPGSVSPMFNRTSTKIPLARPFVFITFEYILVITTHGVNKN